MNAGLQDVLENLLKFGGVVGYVVIPIQIVLWWRLAEQGHEALSAHALDPLNIRANSPGLSMGRMRAL